MTPQRSLNFVAPAQAWLWGHLGGGARRRWVGLLLLLALLLLAAALAASMVQRHTLATQRDTAAARQRSAVASGAAAQGAAAAAATVVLSGADRSRINRVVRSLNTPWAPIFQALESQSSPRVAVLALESDAERGSVRVLTEGPSLDELLAHAQRVQDAAPFVRTQLLRIEAPDTAQRAVVQQPAAAGPSAGQAADLARLSFDLMFVP
jgi:hypothetical protein